MRAIVSSERVTVKSERATTKPDAAARRSGAIGRVLTSLAPRGLPMRVTAYDGTDVGPAPKPFGPASPISLHICRPRGLRYILSAPGDLGLARAYLAGDLRVEGVHPGDPYELFRQLKRQTWFDKPTPRQLVTSARDLGWRAFTPPPPPAIELLPRWRRGLEGLREPAGRRAAAVKAHYDLDNDFFELVLGPSMAYTCGIFTRPQDSLEQAQERKFELVARKLGLRPGMRLLDVGCGWGGMMLQAARHHGVQVVGVTLSGHQHRWIEAMIARAGISDLAQVRLVDYRSMPRDEHFDAISSIGMLEHVGVKNYPTYFRELRDRLRPGGRLLTHSITRPDHAATTKPEAFTDRYVFPDGELAAPAAIIGAAHDTGLELQHEENLRPSYPLTLAAWNANLVRHWDRCVELVGEPTAKVYGLYMAGSRLAFERNWLQVHQFLFTRPDEAGVGGYPYRPDWQPL
ncbi:cyclopropane-fatty-acyl-phospholipid synthase [Kineosphaera limosa]|uniref:Cyclopropane fatty acid synthase n=1 Tax=Kineosphaera limosa NBRC 100340 TaxID=1184609 RepID=K6WUN9_9MICO|nr:class I SAM-dependent methyltransferase [Kineosphaera limosa]NYE00463.1 cyclopropane-fatty-acyl-phospholipid synthase [Kineosphaera limosa]GAB97561.1 cyclopropane fatty acid synthase [Kineosphaera limosa NBRC 100340]